MMMLDREVLIALFDGEEEAVEALRAQIAEVTKASVTSGAIYAALGRLATKKLVTSRAEIMGKPSRRLFRITAAGREALPRGGKS